MEPVTDSTPPTALAGPRGTWVYRTDRPLQVLAAHAAEAVLLAAFFVGLVVLLTVGGAATSALHAWLAA